jgi:hypothetical protein
MTSIKPPVGGMPIRVPLTVEQRQAVERKIVVQAITDLLKAGFAITVNDGEDDVVEDSLDHNEVLDAMFSTDEDYLIVRKSPYVGSYGWVRFIYGNDGPDVINDYTTKLEEVLADTLALVEAEEEKLHG